MGTSDSSALRAREAQRTAADLLETIAADAARARENSEVLRQELMPDSLPAQPDPA